MEIDLNNINQILSKPEFLTINTIEASHELSNNNDIILKKVKAILLLDKVTSSVKSRTIRMDYHYIGGNYISSRV